MTHKTVAVVPIRQLLHEVQCQGFIVIEDGPALSVIITAPSPEATWTPEVRALMARHQEAFDAVRAQRHPHPDGPCFYGCPGCPEGTGIRLRHLVPAPEVVKGGQARTAEELRADARAFVVVGLAAVVLGIVIGLILFILPQAEKVAR